MKARYQSQNTIEMSRNKNKLADSANFGHEYF